MKRWAKTWIMALSVGIWGGMASVEAVAQDGVITLEETTIKGRPQKPEAFYILQYTNLSYETLNTKPTFLDELVKTVEEEMF